MIQQIYVQYIEGLFNQHQIPTIVNRFTVPRNIINHTFI